MKTDDINIRDPFIFPFDGKYYLYGTRAQNCWGDHSYGFDAYVSTDLINWSEPYEVFHKPADFWASFNYWAPEVHQYNGAFYMFATFNSSNRPKGTAILKADHPLGPFVQHHEGSITPADWECLDGTFYLSKDQKPYMIFCHEWIQIKYGEVCAVELSKDLKQAIGEPRTLFKASQDIPWIKGHYDKKSDSLCYVTDGPFLYRGSNDKLHLLWSSFSQEGYTESLAYSDNDDVTGNWSVSNELLFRKDGGHGMIFKSFDGQLYLTVHSPNISYHEHPFFYPIKDTDGLLQLK